MYHSSWGIVMVNKVILVGNLGKDPEVKYTQSGKAVCNFSIATTERYNKEDHTEWHNIVAWGKLAEICGEYLAKGSRVYIEGKITTRKWEDKEGITRYTTEIIAREMKMLSKKQEEDTNNYNHPNPNDDDVPF